MTERMKQFYETLTPEQKKLWDEGMKWEPKSGCGFHYYDDIEGEILDDELGVWGNM